MKVIGEEGQVSHQETTAPSSTACRADVQYGEWGGFKDMHRHVYTDKHAHMRKHTHAQTSTRVRASTHAESHKRVHRAGALLAAHNTPTTCEVPLGSGVSLYLLYQCRTCRDGKQAPTKAKALLQSPHSKAGQQRPTGRQRHSDTATAPAPTQPQQHSRAGASPHDSSPVLTSPMVHVLRSALL